MLGSHHLPMSGSRVELSGRLSTAKSKKTEKARTTDTPMVIFSPEAAGVRKIMGTSMAMAMDGKTWG